MKDILKYIVPYFLLIIVIFLVKWLSLETENIIIYGSIGLFLTHYIRIDNPHPTLLHPLSLSVFAYFFIWGITDYLGWSPTILNIILCLVVVLYFLRFLKREDKLWIDYLKVGALGAVIIAIFTFNKATPSLLFFLGFIYLLDRLIIRRQMKKTTQIIIFSALALVCISFVIFGQIKASDAERSKMMAELAQKEALNQVRQATAATAEARIAEARAMQQAALTAELQAELEKCKHK